MACRNPIGNNHCLRRFLPALIFAALMFAGGSSAIAQPFQVGFGIRIERNNNLLTWKWDTAMVRASTWLKTVLDSALSRDTLFARKYHEWNAAQVWLDTLAAAEMATPWAWKEMDTTLAWWALTLTANEWTNGPAGSTHYIDRVMRFGYNMERTDLSEPSIGQQYESKYYNSRWLMEWHLATAGIDGTPHRPLSATFDRYRGHMLELTVESRVTGFRGDGHGEPWLYLDADDDSTSAGVGSIKLLNGSTLQAADPNVSVINASNNSTIQNVLSTAGNTQVYIGASGWTDVHLQAGSKLLSLNSGGIIAQNCIVAADAADSTDWVISFNQYGWMVKKWLPATLSLSRLTDTLNSVFTSTGGRRMNVANLSLGTNGQYLMMFGGSPTWVTPTWATSLEIADSIAALFGGPRKFHHSRIDFTGFSTGISTDSVKRLGREYAFTSVFVPAVTDTNQTRYFGLANSNGGYATNRAAMLITDRTMIVRSIAMVHVWDSSSAAAYFQRDTVVENTSMDSIPRGSTVWIQYRGAAVFGSPGVQTVRIWYKHQNNTTHDAAGVAVRVPFILGVQDKHRGLGGYVSSSHSLTVTVVLAEKVPGLVY